jgi:hypothetical protein
MTQRCKWHCWVRLSCASDTPVSDSEGQWQSWVRLSRGNGTTAADSVVPTAKMNQQISRRIPLYLRIFLYADQFLGRNRGRKSREILPLKGQPNEILLHLTTVFRSPEACLEKLDSLLSMTGGVKLDFSYFYNLPSGPYYTCLISPFKFFKCTPLYQQWLSAMNNRLSLKHRHEPSSMNDIGSLSKNSDYIKDLNPNSKWRYIDT